MIGKFYTIAAPPSAGSASAHPVRISPTPPNLDGRAKKRPAYPYPRNLPNLGELADAPRYHAYLDSGYPRPRVTLNALDDQGRTALHIAATITMGMFAVSVVDAFARGEDGDNNPLSDLGEQWYTLWNAPDGQGRTPLRAAADNENWAMVARLFEYGGGYPHWGEECAYPLVANPTYGREPAGGQCVCADDSRYTKTNLGECEAVARCAAPAVLNAGTNRCDCPAPNVGTDGADAPGDCAAASAESCGGLTPPAFYDATGGECIAVADCAAPAVLNEGANLCDCPAPNVGADGADAPGDCVAPSAKVCGGLTPAKFYDSAAGECVPFVECAAPSVLYPEANDCHAKTLHEAAQTGDLDSVNHFITVHMANVNVKSNGRTPLHNAASEGHVSIVSALIAAGASVNVQEDDFRRKTPLHKAAGRGHVSVVSMLIAAGAGVNLKDKYDDTPLHTAAHGGKVSIISALIAAGADVNAKGTSGYTALHYTADYRRVSAASIISTLIAAGADVNAKTTNRRYTPLYIALHGNGVYYPVASSALVVVSILIAAGADVNAKETYRGETPLHPVAALPNAYYSGRVSIISALIAARADVNAKDAYDRTPLHNAAARGDVSVVSTLIAAGADVNATTSYGYTPLRSTYHQSDQSESFFRSPTGPAVASVLIAAGGHWGKTCTNGNIVNPAGSWPPCICQSPNVLISGNCVAASAESCGGLTPAKFYDSAAGECVAVAECASPSVLNARANRCDCPAPNVGTDGADAPGDCAVPSAESCGGLTPPQFYTATLSACVSVAECAAPAVLNAGANLCDCPAPNVGADGADAPGDCVAASAQVCGGLTPPQFYAATLSACVSVAECAAPAVLNAGANLCDCPAPNVGADGADAPGDCVAPSVESCGGLTPAKFYAATLSACVAFADCQAAATLNRVANQCECAGAAVLDGAGTGCLCESPNLGTPGDCAAPSVESCGGLTPAKFYDAPAGECVAVAECASPSVLNAGANRCDCPAPNVGTDGADAPGDCAVPSAESCGGLTPAKFYDSAAGECVAVAACAAPAVLNAGANRCDCPAPNVGTDGADAPGDCAAASAESCGGLTPAKFYDAGAGAGECVPFVECAAPSVLNAGANLCDCPAPNIGTDGADTPGDCHAENALHKAASIGDVDSVNHLISVHMADVNAKDDDGKTPLHDAAYWGRTAAVDALLAAGADVNAKDDDGKTPLHWAADYYAGSNDRAPVVLALIAAGADINAKTIGGETPLRMAAAQGYFSIVSALIAAGADVNAKGFRGWTPLHGAVLIVSAARLSIVLALIAARANVNVKDDDGKTPLHYAAVRGGSSGGPRSALIAAGGHWGEACVNPAVVNPATPSPPCVAPSAQVCGGFIPAKFYDAAAGACVPFAECADSKAELNRVTNECECTRNSAYRYLRASGACESSCNTAESAVWQGRANAGISQFNYYKCECPAATATDVNGVCELLYPCHDSAIRKADNSGCECPDGTFAHGDPSALGTATTLTLWAECHADHAPIQHDPNGWRDSVLYGNNPALVAHFISDHKQDPDDGNFALHSAARSGYYSVAKALIEGGADIDRKRSNNTPLHEAVKNGRGPLITLLLQRGADADAKGDDGDTALHLAARRTDTAENVALIAFLLDKGADPNPRNDSGWRPLDLAYHGGTPGDLTGNRAGG